LYLISELPDRISDLGTEATLEEFTNVAKLKTHVSYLSIFDFFITYCIYSIMVSE